MKKIFYLLTLFLFFIPVFSACNNSFSLEPFVSELKSCVYQGQSQTYSLKACYGFIEQPFENDGTVGNKVYSLTFKLLDKETDETTYTLFFNYGDNTYTAPFKLNPITNTLTCSLEIARFDVNEFSVEVHSASNVETVTLKSIIPANTITYSQALQRLQNDQSLLISHYISEDGEFNAEIYVRILVKDDKPFWYVGFASGNNNLKALLIDGISGETLAVREIF